MRSESADAREATALRRQIARRGRVYEPGDHFAQAQPPKASSGGRDVACRGVPERTYRNEASPPGIVGENLRGLRTDIFNLELEPLVIGEKARREKSMVENVGFGK